MTIDPETYDPADLKGRDRDLMRGYDLAVDDALAFLDDDADEFETGVRLFDEVYAQVVARVREGLEYRLEGCRVELTAQLMGADESYWEK